MKICITGARKRDSESDYNMVRNAFFSIYKTGDVILCGDANKGADRFAKLIAKNNDIKIVIFKPNYAEDGFIAGLLRNTKLAVESDALIGCISFERKGGYEDTIRKFRFYNPCSRIILV